MPFTFILVGLFLVIAAVRGQTTQLVTLLKGDLSPSTQAAGQHSFAPWFASILLIGAIGYIPQVKTLSRTFLVLVIVVLFLSNKGFFQNLLQGIPEIFGGVYKGTSSQSTAAVPALESIPQIIQSPDLSR